MEKHEQDKVLYLFSDRLVLKAIGHKTRILNFLALLRRLYRAEAINVSPLLRNKDAPGFHCFINILDTPSASVSSDDEKEDGNK